MRATPLVVTGASVIAVSSIGAAVSIHQGIPAKFGQGFAGPLTLHSDPDNVAGGFLGWRGTGIAPPLIVILVATVFTVLAALGRRAGVIGLTAAGTIAVIGYFGEPAARHALWSDFDPVRATLVVAETVLCALLVVFGVAELRRERVRVPEAVGNGATK